MTKRSLALLLFAVLFGVGFLGSLGLWIIPKLKNLQRSTKQEELLKQGLETLGRERQKLEQDQKTFSERVADQEQRITALERERLSLLDAVRRISERNRELALKEERAEAAQTEAVDLTRQVQRSEKLVKGLEEVRRKEAQKQGSTEKELKQLKKERGKLARESQKKQAQEVSKWQSKVRELEKTLEADRKEIAQVEFLKKELKRLESERKLESSTYYFNLGVVYTRYGIFLEAEKMYLKAIEVNPRDAEAHYNLAVIYQSHLGQKEKAVKHYQEFARLTQQPEAKARAERWVYETQKEIEHPRSGFLHEMKETSQRYLL